MGDRANVHVIDGDSHVFLYSHWDGPYVAIDVQDALKHYQRWDDGSYLTRIIFETMLKRATNPYTGYGISSLLEDNEYPIVHVDITPQLIHIGKKKWSFQEYVDEEPEIIMYMMETETPERPYR
jgi:hypothetical protein